MTRRKTIAITNYLRIQKYRYIEYRYKDAKIDRAFRWKQAFLFFFFILRFVMVCFARRESGRKIRGGE